MADNFIQIPQDLMDIQVKVEYNPDLIRKLFTDMLLKINEMETTISDLETRVADLEA